MEKTRTAIHYFFSPTIIQLLLLDGGDQHNFLSQEKSQRWVMMLLSAGYYPFISLLSLNPMEAY